MKKLILILLSSIILSGCSSLIPRINFDTPNTVPQAVDKSKAKEVCKGKAIWNENGDIVSCSKGYMNYAQNYEKKERVYTIKEKIINIFRNLKGITFWLVIALIFLCPGLLGSIIGRLVEGTYGMASAVNKKLTRAIQKVRKNNVDLNTALQSELDEKHKKYIRKTKDKEHI